jgi:hypothetical protein
MGEREPASGDGAPITSGDAGDVPPPGRADQHRSGDRYSEMLQMFGGDLHAVQRRPGTVERKRPMRVGARYPGWQYYKNILRSTGGLAKAAKLAVLRVREGDTWWSPGVRRRPDAAAAALGTRSPPAAARGCRSYPRGGEIVFEESGDEILYVARPGDHYPMLARFRRSGRGSGGLTPVAGLTLLPRCRCGSTAKSGPDRGDRPSGDDLRAGSASRGVRRTGGTRRFGAIAGGA